MKFGFLKHYRKIKIEGPGLSRVINKCIRDRITLRNLRWRSDIEYTAELKGEDYHRLREMAGHSYKVTVLKDGGVLPVVRNIKGNILTVMGAFLLGALIFYQSMFIAEIRIDGCGRVEETALRETLKEAGVYEGARKVGNYSSVKEMLYETFDSLTWISIYEEGRLLKVNVSESENKEPSVSKETKPVNIVAEQSGIIEDIRPLQGDAKVKKGDYVNRGDVLISGKHKYKSSDYSRGDGEFIMYSHAEGPVMARMPKHITYYFEKNERRKTYTGNSFFGIFVRIGDFSFDTTKGWGGYEVSVRNEKNLMNFIRPLPVCIKVVTVKEAELLEKPRKKDDIQKIVDAVMRQYEKDELKEKESIRNKTVEYSESEGCIKASIMAELYKDIGVEKEIDIKKDKKEREKEGEIIN